ncbi:MAG: hypothetical protein WBX25_28370, partial [Rhodomicrobium sp.]
MTAWRALPLSQFAAAAVLSLMLAHKPAAAAETAPVQATAPGALVIWASLAGIAVAFAILALIFREKARSVAKQCLRQMARLDALTAVEANFRALASLEPQACLIWSDGHPRLALHTLQTALGIPSKLPQILRFGSWLHPDDAGRAMEALEKLQSRGEAFVANAITLEGHVIEIAGAVAGAETVLRIRPFSPVNKELVRLIGENKRLKIGLKDRERLLDSLPLPVWLRDAKGALSWV